MSPARIEVWKIEGVRRYLEKAFLGARFDDYPRGGSVSHLFVVTQPGVDKRKDKRHHLLVTRQFFERFADSTSLQEALAAADVAKALKRGEDRTVELY